VGFVVESEVISHTCRKSGISLCGCGGGRRCRATPLSALLHRLNLLERLSAELLAFWPSEQRFQVVSMRFFVHAAVKEHGSGIQSAHKRQRVTIHVRLD
jgi:hypothetical protein